MATTRLRATIPVIPLTDGETEAFTRMQTVAEWRGCNAPQALLEREPVAQCLSRLAVTSSGHWGGGATRREAPRPPRPEPHRSLPLAATLAWRAQPHPLDFAADSLLREAPVPPLSQGPHLCSPRPSLSLPHHSVVLSFVSCPAPALDIRCPWKDEVQLTPGTPAHLKVSLTSSGPHGIQRSPARRGAASELQDQRTPLCSSL